MQLSEGAAQQLVDQLDHAQDIASEARILRRIKNDLTGHELRKIAYIRAGLIPALTEVLSARGHHLSDAAATPSQQFRHHVEAVWWQASSVIIVLANAGTAFTYALLDSSLISLLTAQLCVTEPCERVTVNILHCLNTFAENLPLDVGNRWTADQSLASLLYTQDSAACLLRLAAIVPDTLESQRRFEVVLKLICNTCRSETHILLLDDVGLLNVLCEQLAAQISFMKTGLYHNSESVHTTCSVQGSSLLTLILETLATMVEHSQTRTHRFATHASVITAVISAVGTDDVFEKLSHGNMLSSDFNLDEQQIRDDFRLPVIPDVYAEYHAKKSIWPPLAASTDRPVVSRRQSPSKALHTTHVSTGQTWSESGEEGSQDSAIVLWLLHIVRSAQRGTRIMAARLIVILKTHNRLNARTVRSLTTLLVPILVEMLDKPPESTASPLPYFEQIPAILALLVKDREFLQQAAVEAKAIPKLAAALKANFESIQNQSSDLWWPTKLQEKLTTGIRDRSLGPGGPSRSARMQMLMREGLLQALAALAPENDGFRKDICDQGALNHILLALEPFHTHTVFGEHYDRISVAGNSSEALIAACGAVRALTRSPTSLRTKIVDADVTKYIINLLYTAEVAVRLAATKVIANLSHGFSPMRTHIAEPSVVKKLCEQAHSAHAELRKETLFALKALINMCPNNLKRTVVEELGVDWIRRLLATDPKHVSDGEVTELTGTVYHKGSIVSQSEDTDMHDVEFTELEHDIERYNRHTLEQSLETLAELLGFLRNLTTGDQPSVIIDFMMEGIGFDEFLHLILDRLKSVPTTYPRLYTKIVENSIIVLAHIAIADAKYRSLVASNLILMKQVNSFLGHTESSIRTACCWLIINVIYSTNESYSAAASRARDLQRIGIVANLRRMEKSDLDANAKERASTACAVFTKLLDNA